MVPDDDISFLIEGLQQDRHILSYLTKPFFTLLQRFFGFLSFCEVYIPFVSF